MCRLPDQLDCIDLPVVELACEKGFSTVITDQAPDILELVRVHTPAIAFQLHLRTYVSKIQHARKLEAKQTL